MNTFAELLFARTRVYKVWMDAALFIAAFYLAFEFKFDEGWREFETTFWAFLPAVILVKLLLHAYFGSYRSIWRYSSLSDMGSLARASAVSCAAVLGMQMTSQLAWIAGSVGGALLGKVIDHKEYGIPFALPSLFICLLVIQIKKGSHLWVVVIAGISSILFKWAFPENWYILLTGLLTSGIGMMIETKKRDKR